MEEQEKPRDIMEDYSKEYERLQKEEIGYIKGKYNETHWLKLSVT